MALYMPDVLYSIHCYYRYCDSVEKHTDASISANRGIRVFFHRITSSVVATNGVQARLDYKYRVQHLNFSRTDALLMGGPDPEELLKLLNLQEQRTFSG